MRKRALTLAVLSTSQYALAAYGVPVVTHISASSFAVEGNDDLQLLVHGFGFGATSAGAKPPTCEIAPLHGESAFVHVSGAPDDPRSIISFPATVVNASSSCSPPCYEAPVTRACCASSLRCDPPPAVLAPGPGTLRVRNFVGLSVDDVRVEYTFKFDVAVDRRPYIDESRGSLLVRCNESLIGAAGISILATLPSMPAAASAGWSWPNVTLTGEDAFEFEFGDALPPTVNTDLKVVISRREGGSGAREVVLATKWRRFMRAAPPATGAGQGLAAAQVDHSTRGVLIGGEPFLGSGWYVADGFRTLESLMDAVSMQARVGDNQVMPYGLSERFDAAEQRSFFDHCASVGIKVIYPLAPTVGKGMRNNYSRHWADPQWQDWVRGNVSIVANHSALLGYYICDDCCPWLPLSQPIGNVSLQAKLYNLLKSLDPLHLVLGAIECNDAWMWTDVASYEPPDPPAPGPVIPLGAQPRLQLSLDVILWEHYVATLADGPPQGGAGGGGGGRGRTPWGADGNAMIRAGAWFEPIVNCFGLWYTGSFNAYPAVPAATRSALWLSVVSADLPSQLTFVLETNAWSSPAATPSNGWLQTVAAAAWAEEARMLAPSLFPRFGFVDAAPVPSVAVVNVSSSIQRGSVHNDDPRLLSPASDLPVRARAWAEACGAETNSSGACIHLVAINLLQHTPVHFELLIDYSTSAEGTPRPAARRLAATPPLLSRASPLSLPTNASRLFDGGYDVRLHCLDEQCARATMADALGAGATAVYELGCNGPRPSASGRGGARVWRSCASRRVDCVHGFPATDPNRARCVFP
jgi:hypothetical protein